MAFFTLFNRNVAGTAFLFLTSLLLSNTCLALRRSAPSEQNDAFQVRKKTAKGNKSHGKFNAQEKARVESNQLQQALSLSQEQASKVFNVAVEKERELNYLKHVRHLHKAEKTAKHDSIISKYEVKLQTILTEEQFASYKSK